MMPFIHDTVLTCPRMDLNENGLTYPKDYHSLNYANLLRISLFLSSIYTLFIFYLSIFFLSFVYLSSFILGLVPRTIFWCVHNLCKPSRLDYILDLMGVGFHSVLVFGLGKDFLFT